MSVENGKRRNWFRRTAAGLAVVLVLSEIPAGITYASQPDGTTLEAVQEDEDFRVTETESSSEEITTGESATGEIVIGETVTGETDEEAVTEETVSAEETSEETSTEDATTEEAGTEEMTTEEATTEEATTEEATTEEEATEETTEEETTEEAEKELPYRVLSEEEIAAQKAMEPDYLPEMEVFRLPESKSPKQFLSTYSEELPTSYDSRNTGILNAARAQNPWGTCWAFASLGIMESAMIRQGLAEQYGVDLAERHLAYFVANTGYDELGNASGDTITNDPASEYLDSGGNIYHAAMKLMNWHGAAAEADFPYSYEFPADLEKESAQSAIAHMKNCYLLNTQANDSESILAVKQMIKEYGAVAWSYYHSDSYLNYSTHAYYNWERSGTNHAIVVVGWDDNFPKEYFGTSGDATTQPTDDGAWIVRNSWGDDWQEDGYFYVSYEDVSMGSGNPVAAMVVNPADDYDNNYFYSNTTALSHYGGFYKVAQVYQIKGMEAEQEKIRAISIMLAGAGTEYSIQIYKNPTLTDGVVTDPESGTAMLLTPVTGVTSYAGVYTIELPTPVTLSADDYAAVVISFPNGDGNVFADKTTTGYFVGCSRDYVNDTSMGQSFNTYSSTGSLQDLGQNGYSLRINMLTDDVVENAGVPTISKATVAEPEGFDSVAKHSIRWNKCSGATGYEVYQATAENGTYAKIAEVTASERSYQAEIEKENWTTKYYYKVRAVFSDGTYAESGAVGLQAEGKITTYLSSAGYSDGKVTLSWQQMSGATGYRIERRKKGETEYQQLVDITDATKTSYEDNMSDSSLGYYEYRVQAYCGTVTAEWSDVKTAGRDLELTPVGGSKVKFEWLPADNVTYYILYVRNKSGNYIYTYGSYVYAGNLKGKMQYTMDVSNVEGFTLGEKLESYVEGMDVNWNTVSTSMTLSYYTKPEALEVTATESDTGLEFSWTGGEGADAVYIYRSMEEDEETAELYATVTDATSYVDTDFPSMGMYYYWIYPGIVNSEDKLICGDGATYAYKVALEEVEISEINQQSENSLQVTWNASAAAESYAIYRSESKEGTYTLLADELTVTSYTDSNLITGKSYYYKVLANRGEDSSLLEETVAKKGQTVPDAAVLSGVTYNSIYVQNNPDYAYAVGKEGENVEGLDFRNGDGAVISFEGLNAESVYYVYVRTRQEITGEAPVYGEALQTTTSDYPIAKTDKLSSVVGELMMESYALNPTGSCTIQIKNQYGELQDLKYFSFTVDNPEVCSVSADGVVVPNPSFAGSKDTRVKITAKAVGDPQEREVVFYVTILTTKQVADIDIERILENAGNIVTEQVDTLCGQKYEKGAQMTFGAKAYDINGNEIENPALEWSVNDESVVEVESNEDGTVTVTWKKAGRVNLTCTAKDSRKQEKVIQLAALTTEPVISTGQVTLNKKSEEITGQRRTDSFTVSAKHGATAGIPTITAVQTGRTKLTEDTGLNQFHVIANGDGSYRVAIDSAFLGEIKNNTVYSVTMETVINGIPEINVEESITESFTIKLKVISKDPSVTVKAGSINRIYTQEEDLTGLLTIKAPDVITNVRVLPEEEGQINGFASYFTAQQSDGQWYLRFADATGKYNKRSLSGKVEITVNGYEPIVKKITVKTPATLPKIKQQSVPVIHAGVSNEASFMLYNSTHKEWLDKVEIQGVSSSTLDAQVDADGRITLRVKDGASYRDGATLSATLTIMGLTDDENAKWTKPLNVKVKVKVFKEKKPSVTMERDTLTLNKQTAGEQAKTGFVLNCQNVSFKAADQWKIYAYNSKTKKYDLSGEGYTDWLTVDYDASSGEIAVGIKSGYGAGLTEGNYKFCISELVEGFAEVERSFTVKVIDKTPSVKVKTTGKLDLVKRGDCTLSGKMTLSNIPSKVVKVTVQNDDRSGAHAYFEAQLESQKLFSIKLTEEGLAAAMTTTKLVLPLEMELENGQKIQTSMTVKPVQSKPNVKVPGAKTLYKSLSGLTVEYDLTSGVTAGTKIKRMETVSVPEGIQVTTEEGIVTVGIADKGMKAGTYKIKVNIYFEGAQAVRGYGDGKPVTKTITVKVVE